MNLSFLCEKLLKLFHFVSQSISRWLVMPYWRSPIKYRPGMSKLWSLLIPNTVRCRYNTVNFLTHIHKRHPIARPLGEPLVSFVIPASNWHSASVPVIIYEISYNIELRYNGTWQQNVSKIKGNILLQNWSKNDMPQCVVSQWERCIIMYGTHVAYRSKSAKR